MFFICLFVALNFQKHFENLPSNKSEPMESIKNVQKNRFFNFTEIYFESSIFNVFESKFQLIKTEKGTTYGHEMEFPNLNILTANFGY